MEITVDIIIDAIFKELSLDDSELTYFEIYAANTITDSL
jgi:hypothetical protein